MINFANANPNAISRRTLLAGAGATITTVALPALPSVATGSASEPVLIEARPGHAQLLETGGNKTPIWGYNGQIPGPVIRARRGGEVWVRLKNSLSQPTTIHWHGIRIDNAMDGVANLTQVPVAPGETFDYRFTVPDAGTFWYHPHNRTWEQLARGLYGVLLVDESDAPDVDRDLLLVADDWRLDKEGRIDEKTLGSLFERSHAGRLGNILTLNGLPEANIAVSSGERIRLRVCNVCNARVLKLRLEDLEPTLIALDGQPVPPQPLADATLRLAPAQRADLIIDMTGSPDSRSAITEVSTDRVVAGHFILGPKPKEPLRQGSIPALAGNNLAEPDLTSAQKVDLVMTGGAMSAISEAVYKGKSYEIRDLVRTHGQVWAMNGIAGMAKKPLFTAKRGSTVILRMANETRWQHAMHLHGHHFRIVKPSGTDLDVPWRDTVLMEPNEGMTIALVADNPGKWMLHCHMLEHQAGGMGTWFEVS